MPDPIPKKSTLDDLRIDRGPEDHRGSRAGLWVVLVVLLILIPAGYFGWKTFFQAVPEVELFTVSAPSGRSDNMDVVLNASGYVTARRKATVSSKVTGKITEVLIEEGMEVKKDQVLARLDVSNVEANLALARAQFASAAAALGETQALLAQAERDLKRTRDLAAEKIASSTELDAALASYDALKARLTRQEQDVVVAQRSVDLWVQEVSDRTIKAPFDGVVVAKNAQPGEMISPVSAGGGFTRTGVGTLVDMSSLEIEVDVNESYIKRVHPKQVVTAKLDSYPEWEIPAKVIAIIPTADRQKATVRVRIGFDALDQRILPDMRVKVAFQAEEAKSVVETNRLLQIPSKAIHEDGQQKVVFVVQSGQVERRAVRIGNERAGLTEIAAGLQAGDRVVVAGPDALADGMAVKVLKR